MSDIVNKINDEIELMGNIMLDDFLIPFFNTGKAIITDENIFIKPIFTMRAEFAKNKIYLFLNNLSSLDAEQIISQLKSFNSNEKVFLLESINKTIDLNDEIQIYILSYLTKQYIENKKLNYYETQLYYSIDTLSKDDFINFYNIYKKEIGDEDSFINYSTIDKDEEQISIKKFESIGLLKLVDNSQIVNGKIVHYFHYKNSEYTDIFIDELKKVICKD